MHPKVSIIIPVYNTEAYVEAAVRTIMEQSLREIEILVIDDGSTDSSLALLTQLAAQDSRIRIYTQPNSGPSITRNVGIEHAEGSYIYFMDSDDLLDINALELCFEKCQAEALDMILFNADTFGADTSDRPWFDYKREGVAEEHIYTGLQVLETMLEHKKYIASPCLYMIRRGLILENKLTFHPHILHEDELFSVRALLTAQRIEYLDRAFFKRRLHPVSIMGSRFSERNLKGYMTVFSELRRMRLDAESRSLVRAYLHYTLNPVLRNAWALPIGVRLRTAAHVVSFYPGETEARALATLLMKDPLKRLLRR